MTVSDASAETARRWWQLYAVAAFTFLPALGFYYVGEEAIFPISALEMWYHNEPIRRLLYGADLQHNPLFVWLIIPVARLLGWELLLPITRFITICATVLTGAVVAWLAQSLYKDRLFSALAAVIYLTLSDLFFYRGWLAYVDPLFALLTFSAIACLWVGCERRQYSLLAVAMLALYAAFMAKTLTAYAFYAGAGVVLFFRADYRRFLLTPAAIMLHVAGAAMLLIWLTVFASSRAQGSRMFGEILAKLAPDSLGDYLLKVLVFPLEALLCLAPAGLLALWLWARSRGTPARTQDVALRVAAGILLVNFLPYWLAPHSHVRYLLPLFPLAGFAIARVLWVGGEAWLARTRQWLMAAIVVKLMLVLIAFPLYQQHYRGANYAETARAILARTAGWPLYITNVTASGLSVAAYIDVAILPQAPLTFPPVNWQDGFVISYEPNAMAGKVIERFRLGGNDLYLLCRGAACNESRALVR